ncbi:MAG: enoyl-CoA hydratase [Myxococcota bacterium]|jgi:enoyl-CoA hydratase
MADPVILVERNDAVATVTLNRPDQMNALSAALRLAIGSTFYELQEDPAIRAVVLTGAGRAFCAGMDLAELSSGGDGTTGHDMSVVGQDEMAGGIAAFEGPIIAAVNGHAVTGGFELALACDMIMASEKAKFADTHARVGILPGWGLSQKLPRLIGVARAKEVSFSGNTLTGAMAYEWGLVNRVVAPEELVPAAQGLAAEMASCVPHILVGYKKLIDAGQGMSLPDALVYERNAGIESSKTVSTSELADRREGVQSRGREQSDS